MHKMMMMQQEKITVSGGSGTQTVTDGAFDSSLAGSPKHRSNAQEIPNCKTLQGDKMEGTLF